MCSAALGQQISTIRGNHRVCCIMSAGVRCGSITVCSTALGQQTSAIRGNHRVCCIMSAGVHHCV